MHFCDRFFFFFFFFFVVVVDRVMIAVFHWARLGFNTTYIQMHGDKCNMYCLLLIYEYCLFIVYTNQHWVIGLFTETDWNHTNMVTPPPPPPIPLDGDSATIRNFGQNDTNRSRNGKSAVEAQLKRSRSAQVVVEPYRNFRFYIERIEKRNESIAPSPSSKQGRSYIAISVD